jgi:hypothetical protein
VTFHGAGGDSKHPGKGIDSTAVGRAATADGSGGTSLGVGATATGARSVALGHNAVVTTADAGKVQVDSLEVAPSSAAGAQTNWIVTDSAGARWKVTVDTTGHLTTAPL